jgi:hypothetical protein
MPEQTFWGMTFEDFCKANPRESFEALRPRYLKIQEENKLHNARLGSEYRARLEADKSQKQRERKQAAEQAALEREAEVKRQFRYRYSTLTEAQYDAFWPDIYKEFLLDESNRREAEMRRDYQF